MIVLNQRIKNPFLNQSYGLQNFIFIFVFAFFSLLCFALVLIYLQETLCVSEGLPWKHPFLVQLEQDYPASENMYAHYTSRHRYCHKFFGSPHNFFKWIIPINFR
jgi:hypothetical protein